MGGGKYSSSFILAAEEYSRVRFVLLPITLIRTHVVDVYKLADQPTCSAAFLQVEMNKFPHFPIFSYLISISRFLHLVLRRPADLIEGTTHALRAAGVVWSQNSSDLSRTCTHFTQYINSTSHCLPNMQYIVIKILTEALIQVHIYIST